MCIYESWIIQLVLLIMMNHRGWMLTLTEYLMQLSTTTP